MTGSHPRCPLAATMIGEIRRQIRLQGISQAEFARRVSVQTSYLSDLLGGRSDRSISLDRLHEWGEELGCRWNTTLTRRKLARRKSKP